MKDGMEQERSWRQGGIHNRSVKKGEVPELGQWRYRFSKSRDVMQIIGSMGLECRRQSKLEIYVWMSSACRKLLKP